MSHLFSIFPDALSESLLARKPVVERGNASLVADDPARHALHSVAALEALRSQVTALHAARGRHKDVRRRGGRVAPVHSAKGIGGARFGAIVRGELGN